MRGIDGPGARRRRAGPAAHAYAYGWPCNIYISVSTSTDPWIPEAPRPLYKWTINVMHAPPWPVRAHKYVLPWARLLRGMRHFQYFGQNIGVRQLIAKPKSIKRGGVRQHFSLASYGHFQLQGARRRQKLRTNRTDAAEKVTKPPLRLRSGNAAF